MSNYEISRRVSAIPTVFRDNETNRHKAQVPDNDRPVLLFTFLADATLSGGVVARYSKGIWYYLRKVDMTFQPVDIESNFIRIWQELPKAFLGNIPSL